METRAGSRIAPPRLALELILHAVEASLRADGLDGKQAHFLQLRLVSKAVKAQAHRSYPNGLSLLANKVVRQLLLERTTPSTFAATLKLATPILGECRRVELVNHNMDAKEEDPVWCFCAALILAEARNLERLCLDCQGAKLNLRQLDLERLSSLATLEIAGGWIDQLCTLDLSGMAALRSFSMATRRYSGTLQPLGLRLPRHLATLELFDVGLTSQDMLDLDFPSFSELQELTVYDEALGVGGGRALHLRQLPRLRRLFLHGPWVSATVLEDISQCKALEELDLTGNDLDSVAELQLHSNSAITSFSLAETNVSSPSDLGLATNQSLVTLDLSENSFSSFFFGLDTNTTLRTLNLGGWRSDEEDGEMPPAHVRQLSAQLQRNTTLERLILRDSQLNDTACRELRLEKTSGLHELNLRVNEGLGDKGVMPLLESIERHGLKVCVHLYGTEVSEEVLERFRRAALL